MEQDRACAPMQEPMQLREEILGGGRTTAAQFRELRERGFRSGANLRIAGEKNQLPNSRSTSRFTARASGKRSARSSISSHFRTLIFPTRSGTSSRPRREPKLPGSAIQVSPRGMDSSVRSCVSLDSTTRPAAL